MEGDTPLAFLDDPDASAATATAPPGSPQQDGTESATVEAAPSPAAATMDFPTGSRPDARQQGCARDTTTAPVARRTSALGADRPTVDAAAAKPLPISPVADPSKQASSVSQRSRGSARDVRSPASSDTGSVRPMTYARQVSFGPQPIPRRNASSTRVRAPPALNAAAYQAGGGGDGDAAVNRAVMMAELRQLHQRAAEISSALLLSANDEAGDGDATPETSVRKPPPLVTRGLSSSGLRRTPGSGFASGDRFGSPPNAFGAADAPPQRRERMKSVFGVTSGPNSRRQSHRTSLASQGSGSNLVPAAMPISNTCSSAHHQQFGSANVPSSRAAARRRTTVARIHDASDVDDDDDDADYREALALPAASKRDSDSTPTRRPKATSTAPAPSGRARIVSIANATPSDVPLEPAGGSGKARTTGALGPVPEVETSTSPDESFSQSTIFVDSSDGTVARRSKGTRRKRRDGFTEHHPLVAGADTAFVFGTVLIWALCFAGLILTDATSARFTKRELQAGYAIAIAAAHVVSIAWVALRFFVQSRRGEWEVLATLHDIRAHYVASRWFVFDVACAVPVDFLFWLWSPTAFFVVELRQFARAARFVSLMASSNPLEERRLWIHVVIFGSCGAFVIHSATCVFQALDGGRYSNALYLTFATMSSVGYGDVVPQANDASRGYAIIVMLLGLAIVAGATAFATSLLTSQNAVEAKAREKKKLLASMLDHFRIPWHEQIEIMSLFPTALDAENVRSFTELVQGMPPFIVERVEAYTRAKALAGAIPLFSELPMAVVLELAGRLQQRVCQANEVLIAAGAVNREMLFLVRGAADVVVAVSDAEEAVVTVLRAGMYFGELGLVRDEAADASVISAVPCELLALARPDFDELTAVHRTLRDLFVREVLVDLPDLPSGAPKGATAPPAVASLSIGTGSTQQHQPLADDDDFPVVPDAASQGS